MRVWKDVQAETTEMIQNSAQILQTDRQKYKECCIQLKKYSNWIRNVKTLRDGRGGEVATPRNMVIFGKHSIKWKQ